MEGKIRINLNSMLNVDDEVGEFQYPDQWMTILEKLKWELELNFRKNR